MAKNQKPVEVSRRKFLTVFVGSAIAAVAAAVAWSLTGYFLSPVFARPAHKTAIAIAKTSEIPIGIPTYITYEEAVCDGWVTTTISRGAWIVNKDGKDFVVYDPHCTHLGCAYYWDHGKNIFQCPCHNGQFDINGNVLTGPPPRPLDRLPFDIVGDSIELITTA